MFLNNPPNFPVKSETCLKMNPHFLLSIFNLKALVLTFSTLIVPKVVVPGIQSLLNGVK